MAWLQVHQTLKDHRKLFDAADELEITPPHMMGLLVSFWLWALDNAPKGDLAGITPRMIARAAQWDGEPEKLAETLIRAGWIDENEDGALEIHDWYEYAGKLIDQRQAEKERSARRRAAAASSSDDTQDDQTPTAGQPPDATPTTGGKSRVDQSREKKGRVTPPTPSDEGVGAGKKSPIEVRFDEFWNAYPKKSASSTPSRHGGRSSRRPSCMRPSCRPSTLRSTPNSGAGIMAALSPTRPHGSTAATGRTARR